MTIANSSGNKVRLGGITKAGNRYLRQMLVVGAMAVIRHAERNGARRPWLVQLLARTATKHANSKDEEGENFPSLEGAKA